MINIIIPAYNAHSTIDKCIASILMQSFNDYDVTIVNDGGNSYLDIISRYKDIMNIREISYPDKINRGPGFARQYGFNHTNGEFVTFMDADDVFYTPFALQTLYNGLTLRSSFAVCAGRFIEETEDKDNVILHQEDMVWMFGKLYRRDFINKFNIKFCPSSKWNEDNGFNCCVRLCSNNDAQINFISDVVYCWKYQKNSITKDDSYAYGKSFVGNIENMLWAINTAKNNNIDESQINQFAVETLFNHYQYLIEAYDVDKRFLKQAWEWLKVYYDTAIRQIKNTLTDDVIKMFYSYTMSKAYENGTMTNIIPFINIYEFINKLHNKDNIEFIENDLSDYFPTDSSWLPIK